MNDFVRVSQEHPCPICGHLKWCAVWHNGLIATCPRVASDQQRGIWGYEHKLDPPIDVSSWKQGTTADPDIEWGVLANYYQEQYERTPWTVARLFQANEKPGMLRACSNFGVGWDGQAYTIPMWRDGECCGIQRRFPNGSKVSIPGSKRGLFIPLTTIGRVGTLYITEGVSDAIYFMAYTDQYVIARQNCDMIAEVVTFVAHLAPTRVAVFADNDAPGIKGAIALSGAIDSQLCRSRVFVPREKDVRETLVRHHELRGRWL
jgi:hypothetical protein